MRFYDLVFDRCRFERRLAYGCFSARGAGSRRARRARARWRRARSVCQPAGYVRRRAGRDRISARLLCRKLSVDRPVESADVPPRSGARRAHGRGRSGHPDEDHGWNHWPQTSERVTDLGAVSPVEASAYFFALIPRIERLGSKDKSRILLPAVLADAGDVIPQLTSLARADARVHETRRQAVMWLGLLGDAKVVPTLVAFARGGGSRLG